MNTIKDKTQKLIKDLNVEINDLISTRDTLEKLMGKSPVMASKRKGSLTRKLKRQSKDEMSKIREDYTKILAESDRPLNMKEIIKALKVLGHKKDEKRVHANIVHDLNQGTGILRVGRGLYSHKESKFNKVIKSRNRKPRAAKKQ